MSETTNYLNYVPYDMLVSETSKNKTYRDTNVLENIFKLAKNMHETILDTTGDYRGFWFIILYPVLMILGVVPRSIFYLVRELSKPQFNYEENFVLGENINKNNSFNVEMREKSRTISDSYNSNKEDKINRAEAINDLRKFLYLNSLILNGKREGNKITFGKNMDELLIQVLPSHIKLDDEDLLKDKLKELYQEDINIIVN